MRKLGPDENAIWAKVARTVRPLKSSDLAKGNDAIEPPPVAIDEIRRSRPPSPRALPMGDSLDGGWDRRLREGRIEPDRTLDLHGMTLDQAWQAIDRLLDRAWTGGDRLVLLVTGREREPHRSDGRGKIRASVKDWLKASRHASHIAAIRGAHRRHGGAGSLYLVLRRH